MRVTAEVVQTRKTETVDLPATATGMDLLERLGLAPDAHLLLRGETPIPVDDRLAEGELIRILVVVSGG